MKRSPLLSWIALVALAATGVSGFGQNPGNIRLRDSGRWSEFEFAPDEIAVHRSGASPAAVREDVRAQVAGGTIIHQAGAQAVVRVDGKGARRGEAERARLSQALKGAEVAPVLYPVGAPHNQDLRHIPTKDVLVKVAPGADAKALADSVKASGVRATIVADRVLFSFPSADLALEAALTLQKRGVEADPQLRRQHQKRSIPDDPFFPLQWHLRNTGQGNGLVGADANVLPAWDITKGTGVTIAIVDDSFQVIHPDIEPNTPPISSLLHHDFNGVDDDPEPEFGDQHGISVSGVAAARGNNTFGVTGSAPEAQLVGLRLISGPSTDLDDAQALYWHPTDSNGDELLVGASNNSWGPTVYFAGPDVLARQALQDAATLGRGGLGQVTLFAGGNSQQSFNGSRDSNADGFANSRFVIGVGASDNLGKQSYYSQRGANLLVCAPSSGGTLGVFTTDLSGFVSDTSGNTSGGYNPGAGEPSDTDYTNSFGGTSSATPLTTGGVALMLSANPALGWRDVHEILAATAQKIDPTEVDWVTNGAGFHFNHRFGGGVIDLTAAVVRAKDWDNLAAEETQSVVLAAPSVPIAIPETAAGISRSFDFTGGPNLRVERVEVVLNIQHSHRSDLDVTITSPEGTVSKLMELRPRPSTGDFFDDDSDVRDDNLQTGWTFTTTHSWGENSDGQWVLKIRDLRGGSTGTLRKATVNLFGTPSVKGRFRFATQRTLVTEKAGGSTIKVRIERLGDTQGVASIDYVVSPDSTASVADFTATGATVNFVDGQTFADVSIPILDDLTLEVDEFIYLLLKTPVNAALGGNPLHEIKIVDNEQNTVSITATDADATETRPIDPADTGLLTVAFQAPVLVDTQVFFTLSGSAVKNSDYKLYSVPDHKVLAKDSVVITAGFSSAQFTLEPIDDLFIEGSETVSVQLAPNPEYLIGTPNQAVVTIVDNEKTDIAIVASTTSVVENDPTPVVFTVSRHAADPNPLSVPLLTGGTARPNVDFNPPVPTLVEIPAGAASVTFSVIAIDNLTFSQPRVLTVGVGSSADFKEGFTTFAQVTFRENDPAPDIRAPLVKIITPADKAQITAPAASLIASGTASDNGAVAEVRYRVNNLPLAIADGTTDWSKDIINDVVFGPNILEVFAIDDFGNKSTVARRAFDYLKARQLTIQKQGNGTVNAVSGSRNVGFPVALIATPQPGFVFDGWTDGMGTLLSTAKVFSFPMPDADLTLVASFVASPFNSDPPITGTYSGLVRSAGFSTANSGYIQLQVLPTGGFTGKLNIAGAPYPLKGDFTGHGRYRGIVSRKFPLSNLAIDLTLDVVKGASDRIIGTITTPEFTANVQLDRSVFSTKAQVPTALVGKYTLFFQPLAMPVVSDPRGQGSATLTIAANGTVKWTGTLPDGTKASQTAPLSKAYKWPLFVTPYKKGGVAIGEVAVADQIGSHMNGTFDWQKLENVTDAYFANGFTRTGATVLGSRYATPAKNVRIMSSFGSTPNNSGRAVFREGNLVNGSVDRTFEKNVTLSPANLVTVTTPAADRLSLRFNTTNGTFTGSFVHPHSGKVTLINGVVFGASGEAYGSFFGSLSAGAGLQTGQITITTQPPPP